MQSRSWLRELAVEQGEPMRMPSWDAIPNEQLERWADLGFTHVWCMGVWTISPASRRQSLQLHRDGKLKWPTSGVDESDVTGSPYSIVGYDVDPSLGGEAALNRWRSRLNQHGLGLMLDYIPNHVGLDHPWLRAEADWFVQGRRRRTGFFDPREFHPQAGGVRWVAHGKDPYFPAWMDTAQLDYRVPALRRRMSGELARVGSLCDAMRIDMAMLVLSDVFEKTWTEHPPQVSAAAGEFWHEALDHLKNEHPDRWVLGEVYWELETRLLEIGFDSVYDKEFYDGLVGHRGDEVQKHVDQMSEVLFQRGCRFLENHDEPRIAGLLNRAEHGVAAGLMLGMPGAGLVHDGQMEGRRVSLDIRVRRRAVEAGDGSMGRMYEEWLRRWKGWGWHDAEMRRLAVSPAWDGNPSHGAMVALQWGGREEGVAEVFLFNLASHEGQVRLQPVWGCGEEWGSGDAEWEMAEGDGKGAVLHPEEGHEKLGRMISMPGYGFQRFRCVRRGRAGL